MHHRVLHGLFRESGHMAMRQDHLPRFNETEVPVSTESKDSQINGPFFDQQVLDSLTLLYGISSIRCE
jgi:hypothetical protein